MSARIPREVYPSEDNNTIRLPSSEKQLIKCPYVDPQLLAYLRQIFVSRVAAHYDLRTYDRQVGQQEVIDCLQKSVEEQEDSEREKYV